MTFWKRRNVVPCFKTFYRRIVLSNYFVINLKVQLTKYNKLEKLKPFLHERSSPANYSSMGFPINVASAILFTVHRLINYLIY